MSPRASAVSAALASASARSAVTVTKALSFGSRRSMRSMSALVSSDGREGLPPEAPADIADGRVDRRRRLPCQPPGRRESNVTLGSSVFHRPRVHLVDRPEGVGQQAAHELEAILGNLDACRSHAVAELIQGHASPPVWENTATSIPTGRRIHDARVPVPEPDRALRGTVSQAAYLGSRMEYSIDSEIGRCSSRAPRSTRRWRPGRRSS